MHQKDLHSPAVKRVPLPEPSGNVEAKAPQGDEGEQKQVFCGLVAEGSILIPEEGLIDAGQNRDAPLEPCAANRDKVGKNGFFDRHGIGCSSLKNG